ncbi:hypothetical protein [Sphingomonas sp. R1]|uniref:hypothetical protein n=1 Tax=Sphingomonas sp. R1 TaxID=399176 RepID=UPI0022253A7C|nr:hypothetical protein [Sphingomonas sp. R1]UYY79558.1 hypothetical protein OIM94_19790 [Sphingomonas sp. R1]
MAATPTPDFTVSDENKKEVAAHIVPAMMQTFRAMSSDRVATADDLIDTLSLCIASLLENDTHITTPKHTKDAMQSIETFVRRWARRLRDERPSPDAPSFLMRSIEQYRAELAEIEAQGDSQA